MSGLSGKSALWSLSDKGVYVDDDKVLMSAGAVIAVGSAGLPLKHGAGIFSLNVGGGVTYNSGVSEEILSAKKFVVETPGKLYGLGLELSKPTGLVDWCASPYETNAIVTLSGLEAVKYYSGSSTEEWSVTVTGATAVIFDEWDDDLWVLAGSSLKRLSLSDGSVLETISISVTGSDCVVSDGEPLILTSSGVHVHTTGNTLASGEAKWATVVQGLSIYDTLVAVLTVGGGLKIYNADTNTLLASQSVDGANHLAANYGHLTGIYPMLVLAYDGYVETRACLTGQLLYRHRNRYNNLFAYCNTEDRSANTISFAGGAIKGASSTVGFDIQHEFTGSSWIESNYKGLTSSGYVWGSSWDGADFIVKMYSIDGASETQLCSKTYSSNGTFLGCQGDKLWFKIESDYVSINESGNETSAIATDVVKIYIPLTSSNNPVVQKGSSIYELAGNSYNLLHEGFSPSEGRYPTIDYYLKGVDAWGGYWYVKVVAVAYGETEYTAMNLGGGSWVGYDDISLRAVSPGSAYVLLFPVVGGYERYIYTSPTSRSAVSPDMLGSIPNVQLAGSAFTKESNFTAYTRLSRWSDNPYTLCSGFEVSANSILGVRPPKI
jgi:hypothetical protein